ncbi:hypothetical protein [Pseudomonas indica]|nr:hypothetical protein [Pseudomonas indica]
MKSKGRGRIYRFDSGLYFVNGLDNDEPMYDFSVNLNKKDSFAMS